MTTWQVGDSPLIRGTATVDGVNTDGTIVGQYIVAGTETVEVASTSNPSTGVYEFRLPLTVSGRWYARFAVTGDVVAAAWTKIDVESTPFD